MFQYNYPKKVFIFQKKKKKQNFRNMSMESYVIFSKLSQNYCKPDHSKLESI